MSASILATIKKALGVEEEYTGFDDEILLGINTAIMELNQLGIGPADGLVISDTDQTWTQLIGTDTGYEGVKTYIQLRTRLLFDPPSSATVLEAQKEMIKELGIRLNLQVESDLTKPVPLP